MKERDFTVSKDMMPSQPLASKVHWNSPSNLAIVKYWGKYGQQLPRNPSLSITLSKAITSTSVTFNYNPKIKALDLSFSFEGNNNEPFKNRILKYLNSLDEYFPFLNQLKLDISSSNSFPHSSGIASSASSMSALALCLCDIEKELINDDAISSDSQFFRKASFISRLGSGSACRSLYPQFALWGECDGYTQSSDLYAVPVSAYHEVYNTLRNDILIVSKSEKSVSSSAGHRLMESNIYAEQRFLQARERTHELKEFLIDGNLDEFGKLLESEALTLHALMMASDPSYMLMEPNTIQVINKIRAFRQDTKIPVYFSLDAGPNVHIISFEKDRQEIRSLLEELHPYAVDGKVLNDYIGLGPQKVI